MGLKKTAKGIANFSVWVLFEICSLIIKLLPGRCLYGFATLLALLSYYILSRHRRVALESLRIAFGQEKSLAELKRIAKVSFVSMAKSAVELLYLMDKPHLLRNRVRILGKEYLDAALKEGKGVILVSAHFGNFPLLLARLSLEGYTTGGIMRPMRDARMEKIFLKKRKLLKIKTIYSQPRRVCVETAIKALRNNELVFIPLDQNFGTAGIFVDFFGRKAATATGPVILAQRTKSAVIPCFIARQPDNTQNIILEPPLQLKYGLKDKDSVLINIQNITNIIEKYIRRYPVEWGWIHRRWKSQPSRMHFSNREQLPIEIGDKAF